MSGDEALKKCCNWPLHVGTSRLKALISSTCSLLLPVAWPSIPTCCCLALCRCSLMERRLASAKGYQRLFPCCLHEESENPGCDLFLFFHSLSIKSLFEMKPQDSNVQKLLKLELLWIRRAGNPRPTLFSLLSFDLPIVTPRHLCRALGLLKAQFENHQLSDV